MTAATRATGPPTERGGPPRGAGLGEQRLGGGSYIETNVPAEPNGGPEARTPAALSRAEFVQRLLDLGRRRGPLPIYGSREWEALPAGDPRRFASVVRAAECWRLDGTGDAVRERLERELAENDWLTRQRIREAGLDVHSASGTGDLGEESHGRPFTWASRAELTPIAKLRRLRTYEPKQVVA